MRTHRLMHAANTSTHMCAHIHAYTMKVLRQKSFAASCTRRPSQKNFAESHILSLKSEQCHLELSYKSFADHVKTTKTAKLFCLETFMVYSRCTYTRTHTYTHITILKYANLKSRYLSKSPNIQLANNSTYRV